MKSATERFEELLIERGKDFYGRGVFYREYHLYLLDETPTRYVLGNGRGESVSDERDINVQFMLMKEMLGFETIEDGEYVLRPSKFDDHLRLNCLTLGSYEDWLFRVVEEEQGFYLGLTSGSSPAGWEKVPGTGFFVKWLPASAVIDVSEYWGGAPGRSR
ncbi:MAG: hypothetical protein ACJ74T_05540 [Pyrinomonadaceae bacterium]